MREILLDEMKKIEFSILKEFKSICEQQNLNYSLLAGTLLGAVRHKGFIPWDDDIDVMMPRPDYELFKQYCLSHETDFVLLCHETNPYYGYMFAKLYHPGTVIYEEHTNRYNIEMGVYIDIFIYDGLGDSVRDARRAFNKSALERELLIAANWKHYFRLQTYPFFYEPLIFVLYLLSRPFGFSKLINSIEAKYRQFDFYNSKYVGNLCSGIRAKCIIERSCFDDYIELEFEGERFKALKGYETYLKKTYGSYMELPPENKRVTHHAYKAYWK